MTLIYTAYVGRYEVYDIESCSKIGFIVAYFEIVPLRKATRVEIVLQNQIIAVLIDFKHCH